MALEALCGALKGLLRKVDPHTVPQFGILAECATAFHRVDPTGEVFRYSQQKDGKDP